MRSQKAPNKETEWSRSWTTTGQGSFKVIHHCFLVCCRSYFSCTKKEKWKRKENVEILRAGCKKWIHFERVESASRKNLSSFQKRTDDKSKQQERKEEKKKWATLDTEKIERTRRRKRRIQWPVDIWFEETSSSRKETSQKMLLFSP